MELALNHEPYGKLPEVAMPPSRTRPLPPLVPKPATPSSAAAQYKLTPKTMKRLMIMESPASPAQGDNEQRVLNELLSPHTHVKKLVITEADQQNLSLFESARKQQKSVLKDLSNQQKEQTQFSPPPTPYQAPRKPTLSLSQLPSKPEEQSDQTSLRQSAKDNSLSLSVNKPTPIRVTPSDSFYQNPSLESATNVNSASKSRGYNSYTEAVIDNRTDAEVDKSVPVPKCTRNGVHTIPSMDILLKMTKDELMNVRDFTVFKDDVGRVIFMGTTDVRGLDIDRIVAFKDREIVVYPNESDKPTVGEGLNKPAEITLSKCWPMDKKTNRPTDDPTELEGFVKKLKRRCRKWGVQYKSYEHGNWTFALEHFD
jgi:nuclear pore complex protein Nup98-Nup96